MTTVVQPVFALSMCIDSLPHRFPDGIFLDGVLENKMGFDIPLTCSADVRELPDGLYPVKVGWDKEHPEKAIMAFYRVTREIAPFIQLRGLIASLDDAASLERVYAAFVERRDLL